MLATLMTWNGAAEKESYSVTSCKGQWLVCEPCRVLALQETSPQLSHTTGLTLPDLYHTTPHRFHGFEVTDKHGSLCFIWMHSEGNWSHPLSSLRILYFLFFFFAFPSYISGVHHFWVRFLHMWPFFNPTIKVVTFRLRGWCVLGVFLLLAFTRLGHELQDLLSPCDEMHVCTD